MSLEQQYSQSTSGSSPSRTDRLGHVAAGLPAQRRPPHPAGELLQDYSQIGLAFKCPFKCCDENTRPATYRHRKEFNAHIGNKRAGEKLRDENCVKPGKHGNEYPMFDIKHVDIKAMKWFGFDGRGSQLSGEMVEIRKDRPETQHNDREAVTRNEIKRPVSTVAHNNKHQKSKEVASPAPPQPAAAISSVDKPQAATGVTKATVKPETLTIDSLPYIFTIGELIIMGAREAIKEMGGLTAEDYNRPASLNDDDDESYAESMGADGHGHGAAVTPDVITNDSILVCHEYGVTKLGLREALRDVLLSEDI